MTTFATAWVRRLWTKAALRGCNAERRCRPKGILASPLLKLLTHGDKPSAFVRACPSHTGGSVVTHRTYLRRQCYHFTAMRYPESFASPQPFSTIPSEHAIWMRKTHLARKSGTVVHRSMNNTFSEDRSLPILSLLVPPETRNVVSCS